MTRDNDDLYNVVMLLSTGNHMTIVMRWEDANQLIEGWAAWKRGLAMESSWPPVDYPTVQGGVGWAILSHSIVGIYSHPVTKSTQERVADAMDKMVGGGEEWKE